MRADMLEGSCLCGAVKYRIEGELGPIVCCHCSMCRKAQGTAFAANAPVPASRFRIVAGEASLRAYRSSPGKERLFCGTCGSPIVSRRDGAADVRVRIGTLDTRIAARPAAHIHVASKAEWWEIGDDDLPRHAAFEPGRTRPA
jgi:hypothetical protein